MFRLEMRTCVHLIIYIMHSIGTACNKVKLKIIILSIILEQLLPSGWITNNKSSLDDNVFVELLLSSTNSDKYKGAEWPTKDLRVKMSAVYFCIICTTQIILLCVVVLIMLL